MALNSLSEGCPMSTLYSVCALTRRYLIMMDFDPFSSPKVVSRWRYPIVSFFSPTKPMSCSRNDLSFSSVCPTVGWPTSIGHRSSFHCRVGLNILGSLLPQF